MIYKIYDPYDLKNLYKDVSNSQKEGLLNKKPLYLITDKEEDPIKKIGDGTDITVYKEEINGSPFSVLDSDTIVNAVSSVLKDAKKIAKKE